MIINFIHSTINSKECHRPVLGRKQNQIHRTCLSHSHHRIHTDNPDDQDPALDNDQVQSLTDHIQSLAVFSTCLCHQNFLECKQTDWYDRTIYKHVDRQKQKVNKVIAQKAIKP